MSDGDAGDALGMAELTSLDEKLAEVLGLAQAAQDTTDKVAKMEGADAFSSDLDRMRTEAEETERRTQELVDSFEGKKTAINDKARETKQEAAEMRDAYLEGEEEALDGFEFLSMSEAGELCHWEIVQRISEKAGEDEIRKLADGVLDVQRRHIETVRAAYLALAEEEAEEQ